MRKWFVIFILFALMVAARAQDSVTTLAGQPLVSGAANGAGTNALFSDPAAMVADAGGNLFVADSQNHAIRKISPNGIVSTLAGQLGMAGSADAPGTNAQFNSPCGLALDTSGNLFVSDTGNHTIRKVTTGGVVTTVAGAVGQGGFINGVGLVAQFNSPLGLMAATNGTIYVADSGNHCIRSISNGVVSTFAGSPQVLGSADGAGTNAQFNGPVGLALNAQGNLFVSDSNNHTIRKIKPDGTVSTWAGSAGADGCVDGPAATAKFCKPAELALDRNGNLFVADSFYHVIRKISSDGIVSTVTGCAGSYGTTNGINGHARFFNPYGLAVRPDGALMVTDAFNELIREVLVPFGLVIQAAGANQAVTIFWSGVVGQTYQVQYKNSVAADGWLNLGAPVVATNQSLSLTDVMAASGVPTLYRVVVP